ncbi:MFS transporter, partial [Dermacoccus nishinomiyaensis]
RIGRRRLMLVMLPGAAVSIAAFGIAFWVTNDDPPAGVALALILSFMFFQAGGIQVVGWLMGSELYPLKVRSAATALHAAALWGSNLLITLTALTLIDWLSLPGAMIFYAVINVIAWVTVYFFVPETRGRSLEEIESSLQDGTFLPHRGRKRSPADA